MKRPPANRMFSVPGAAFPPHKHRLTAASVGQIFFSDLSGCYLGIMPTMSAIQLLTVLVNERLSAAADDIMEAVKKVLAEYEEEVLTGREIHRYRWKLQTSGETETSTDRPHLALSVWDDDFPSDQQQKGKCEPHYTSSPDQGNEEPTQTNDYQQEFPSSQDKVVHEVQVVEEDGSIGFIFKHQLSSSTPNRDEEGPLPSTSGEECQVKVEASSNSSATSSDEEGTSSEDSQSNSSDTKRKKKKNKELHLVTASKLHLTKKHKSQTCCKVCGKAFRAIFSLVNHMEVHPKDVCGVCGECFDGEEKFHDHLKSHVKAEICSICGKCFGSSRNLENHMRIHTGEKPFVCSMCGKSFNCHHNLMRHIRIHTGERPYTCSVCGKCFNDGSTLKRHLLVHINEKSQGSDNLSTNESGDNTEKLVKKVPSKSRAICEVCGNMFHSMVSLINHAKTHSSDVCGVCGMRFDSEENLKSHLKTHKNGKVCEVCGKCFDSHRNLEMHMRIHTGEKPFVCSECGKSFNCRHNMMRHVRTHTGEKPYVCNICNRSFSEKSSLKLHSSTHTGAKPYHCKVCGKGFPWKKCMTRHMKSHETEN